MAQTVKLKRSAVAAKVPLTSDLALGELAVNTNDGVLYTLMNDGTNKIVQLGGQSVSATVTAGTNAQGQGPLTSNLNVVTSTTANPSGVTLPTALLGRNIYVVNKGTNPINVYPATGGQIDAAGTNVSIQIPVNGVVEFNATSLTQWYSSPGVTGGNKGDITVSDSGATWTINNSAVTSAKIATNTIVNANLGQVSTATFKGRATAGTGNVEDLTGTQATTLLDTFTSTLKGLAPASGGGTTNFLRADGTWAAPSGSGVSLSANNAFTGANTFTNTTGQTFRQAATQDGIIIQGRAGGTGSFDVSLTTATLSADRTLTLPNVTGTVVTTGDTGTVTATMIAPGTVLKSNYGQVLAVQYGAAMP